MPNGHRENAADSVASRTVSVFGCGALIYALPDARGVHGSTGDGLVEVDVSVPYLDIEATVGVGANPSLVVDGCPLAPEVRQWNKGAAGTFMTGGKRSELHRNLLQAILKL